MQTIEAGVHGKPIIAAAGRKDRPFVTVNWLNAREIEIIQVASRLLSIRVAILLLASRQRLPVKLTSVGVS